ncbi:hypothetical protein DEV92_11615 [Phyllobacterium myrsinacearum]|nr:hypothetical protein DEV92_11615 [Phyllobacterium myrsinacearum]RZS76674.1 hypothetical protein EV217_4889 [Phyllobacterium myrsinacearum]RZU96883.1 hypothetical protein EV654_5067 [Phyllobacterium myrsinacearum]
MTSVATACFFAMAPELHEPAFTKIVVLMRTRVKR